MGVLEIRNVSYFYNKDRMVINDVSESFESGKMYVILGPSGCGKTTLLSLLGGLDIPKSGEIFFKGQKIRKVDLETHRRSHVSFVFQNYNLIEYMTSVENVELTAKQDAFSILEKLGLTKDEAKRNVMKLSGGQQQRVAIARALASGNPVILADEPTGSVALVQHYPKQMPVIFPSLSTFISSMTDRQRVRFSLRVKVSYIALKSAVKIFLMAAKSGGASCAGFGSFSSAAVYIS